MDEDLDGVSALTISPQNLTPLMVRVGFARRDALVAASPDTFYLTKHYEPFPVVLARLLRISRADLAGLLKEGWEPVQREDS